MLKNTLLYMARNESVRKFVMNNQAARGVSRRFVAGEQLDEAIAATRTLNEQGLHVTLDHLGENVTDEQEAVNTAQGYIEILDRIKASGVDANISIKLTALGLDISKDLCEKNLTQILEHAQQFPIFVRIDMEGSAYTERTVDITLRMHERFEHVGTVIQSCLYRSRKDVEQLILQGARVRLVKPGRRFRLNGEVLIRGELIYANTQASSTDDSGKQTAIDFGTADLFWGPRFNLVGEF